MHPALSKVHKWTIVISLRWHYPTGSNGLRQISRTLSLLPQTPAIHYSIDKAFFLKFVDFRERNSWLILFSLLNKLLLMRKEPLIKSTFSFNRMQIS